jgi:hypothetical protein
MSLGKGELAAWTMEDKEQVAPCAVELRHAFRRLVKHLVLPGKDFAGYVEDEPPPRAKPGTTEDGNLEYPEQTLTAEEMESGVKVQDISEGLEDSIRKARVVVEETKAPEVTEEEELADPMVVGSEETYLKEFDADVARSKTPP